MGSHFFAKRLLIWCLCKICKTYRPHKNTLRDYIYGCIHHSHLPKNPFCNRISKDSRIGTDCCVLQHFFSALTIMIVKEHAKNIASDLDHDSCYSNGHTCNKDLMIKLNLE